MLQKRIDFEIVEQLRKEPQHIRLIAERLDLIPSTVMRTMRQLEKENVVDYKLAGKNKTYSLKSTPEARNHLFMTEGHKFSKILQNAKIRKIAKDLIEQTDGELIVLFGSYSKGIENKDSDIDIYIETDDNNLKKKLSRISDKLSIKTGKLDKDNLLTKEIIKNHIIIQNIERFYQLIK
ncbi:nucleotidyltransferase domain-containing protein [Candidatus Woesearchaeota archaeon]|nr:nucleotidyltransferase domain-containing protein [Candidatus Woesearchaeota archaeon]